MIRERTGAPGLPARLGALAAALVLAPLAVAGDEDEFPREDPYTAGTPAALQAAGYVSLGPFRFGDGHSSDQVSSELGIPMAWAETAHFKIGSGLRAVEVGGDREERKRMRAELAALGEHLDGVKSKARELDPWLRLHLFARRLENLQAEFQQRLGSRDEDWPTEPWDTSRRPTAEYMGEGPYLGMPAKFTVLIFQKKSDLSRYSVRFLGTALDHPTSWIFPETGSLLYLTAFECLEGDYHNETGLTCAVLAGVAGNLARGFRSDRIRPPLFFTEGLAHWFARRYDPRFHILSGSDPTRIHLREQSDWGGSVRARVSNGYFTPLDEMLGWKDFDQLDWADHLMMWSRVDHLLDMEEGAARRFLLAFKDPTFVVTGDDEVRERSLHALREATGQTPAELDATWQEWVAREYKKKR
jgi:hypothetical protein